MDVEAEGDHSQRDGGGGGGALVDLLRVRYRSGVVVLAAVLAVLALGVVVMAFGIDNKNGTDEIVVKPTTSRPLTIATWNVAAINNVCSAVGSTLDAPS